MAMWPEEKRQSPSDAKGVEMASDEQYSNLQADRRKGIIQMLHRLGPKNEPYTIFNSSIAKLA